MKTKLSILIPTKDRYSTLLIVLNSILENFERNDYEIIIQDNTYDNSNFIRENKALLENSNVRYFHISEPLSISDNTEHAIENATGNYITFIGDDDFISPNIMTFVDKLELLNGSCLIYEPAFYWWDSVQFHKQDYYNKPCNLWLPKNISLEFEKLQSQQIINNFNNKGGVSILKLPRLYHGIVKTDVLKKIKNKTGNYVLASSPDISLAIALALTIDDYFYVRFPISVYGASKNSGGGWTASKTHYNKIENVTFLQSGIEERWNRNIPYIWSERTIYPQSAFEVGNKFKSDRINLNYTEMYASLLTYESYLYKIYIPALIQYKNSSNKNNFFYIKIAFLLIKKYCGKLLNLFKSYLRIKPLLVISNIRPEQVSSNISVENIKNER